MLKQLMDAMATACPRLAVQSEDGQALVEYGLLVGLIAVVCVVIVTTLGGEISNYFQSIVNAL